jgi:hypothetical protein
MRDYLPHIGTGLVLVGIVVMVVRGILYDPIFWPAIGGAAIFWLGFVCGWGIGRHMLRQER